MKTSPLVRHPSNPILTTKDVPYPASLIFNAGVAKYRGQYLMVFRNDYGCTQAEWESGKGTLTGTNLGLATSFDGVKWSVKSKPILEWGAMLLGEEIRRLYDPRITIIEDRAVLCFALDTAHGIRGGIAVTEDFENFEIKSLTAPDNRNMVLFPEKINGNYVRLERPFPVYSRGGKDRFDLWLSESPDLVYWGKTQLVLAVEDVPFANDKIGPAAPPIKTKEGWLTTFHAVDKDESRGKNGWETKWTKRYTAGLMLLDLENPSIIKALSALPLLSPEAPYEKKGFRGDVIFPGGLLFEESGEVKMYYGAADTVECLASAHVDELLSWLKTSSKKIPSHSMSKIILKKP
jgi:beta-1,4-mannooligosaccharide/beta-1,4-mannosyl-N-acetylglucosamine phosphorylase